jgi:hypothetical protein
MRKLAVLCLLFLPLACVSAQSREWSNWAATYGPANGIEYRWRMGGICTAVGCGKDLQFRNNTSHQLVIKYVAQMERMGDTSSEVTEDGTTSLAADSTGNVLSLSSGVKVLRVRAEAQ